MKYLLIFLTLITVAVTDATGQTAAVQTKVDALNAAPGVLEAWIDEAPKTFGKAGTLYFSRVAWVQVVGTVVEQKGADVLVKVVEDANHQVTSQTAYWVGTVPGPLAAAVPDAYITGRTTPFTKAQVEAFCNTQWKATSGNTAARDVIEFSVTNVTANTVRVQGLFHDVATGNRVRMTYLITLVDPNGATSGTNVKFEKVVE